MKKELPDIDEFEQIIFKKKNALNHLLSFSLSVLDAKHVGLLQGTNKTYKPFLPPDRWDRGVMHKFNGKGIQGMLLKYFGTIFVKSKGLSPVKLYKDNQFGEKVETDGIISYVLRKHTEFYKKGVKILIIDNIRDAINGNSNYSKISILSYNGKNFRPLPDLKINNTIVKCFKAKNFVSAYIPDYGAIVFNTINETLLEKKDQAFVNKDQLKNRLNMMIHAIEMASLAYIGLAKGRQAAHLIWRKEKSLRKAALNLKDKELQLNDQKRYLRAVGAVNTKQLNMEAVNITNGVYAFMDMVGSATIRKNFSPRDYFYILNFCHQIAADNASRFACRVDNFMGDAVFLETATPFDDAAMQSQFMIQERIMLMVFALASTFKEMDQLKKGCHTALDESKRVAMLMDTANVDLSYRAGMETGSAMIGPLGSNKRRIVTAIGKAVNNASRLESTGHKNGIHISKKMLNRLKNSYITKDTPHLYSIVSQKVDINSESLLNGLAFFDAYQSYFNLNGDVLNENSNISYKEFSQDVTYFIKCV